MDMRTGQIGPVEQMLAQGVDKKYLREVTSAGNVVNAIRPENLPQKVRAQLAATGRAMLGRNSPCPCGSMKRFKRCCMMKE